jgi:alkanesulfonate monooxygenase SsuD/methylene tetrahydromethanopterin reductase-like flavin-dependent oxidoreductase (luciferase family)
MLNEHHNAPFCMQAKCNVFASILAAITKRVKIVLLGNPLPLADNPVRLAEELAMIDMVSRAGSSRASCAAAARSSSPPA